MTQEQASGPCAGVRVLEITTMVSGPMAGLMLADLGATVTKIESLEGDPLRHLQPSHKGMCAQFFAMNRHKRSIQLDLKSEGGRAIARKLAMVTDVLIVNARPGVMERLGLGYDSLAEENPGLIYIAISGFGEDGPYVNRPAYDQVIQSLTGSLELQNPEGPPTPLRGTFVDKYTATAAASAATAALYHRERNNGQGQFVSLSLMNAFASFLLVDNLYNKAFLESDNRIPSINIMRPMRTADGSVMGHIQTNEQFALVCRILGREELLQDERFKSPWQRIFHYDEMWEELEKAAINFTSDQLDHLFLTEGAPVAKVNSVDEFLQDAQARHAQSVVEFDDPDYGPVRVANYPARFSRTPAEVRGTAPKPGEHADIVLGELGMTATEIASARAAGIIR